MARVRLSIGTAPMDTDRIPTRMESDFHAVLENQLTVSSEDLGS